jgi:hypothetical protein
VPLQETTILATLAAIVSAFVATAGLLIGWKSFREAALRRGEVLSWASEVICALQSLLLICTLKKSQLEAESIKRRLEEIIFNTSILVERGRLFFRNQVMKGFGDEKEPAFRGYRPKILDQIVIAHQIAREWTEADEDTQLRMRLVAEDCLKKFVSLVQKEVGRDRTASADASEGGLGIRLPKLLAEIDERRLNKIKNRS